MRALGRLVAPVMTILVVTACATSAGRFTGAPPPWVGPEAGGPTSALVEVSNYNWADAVVYLLVNGSRVRLGEVRTARTNRFRIDRTILAATEIRIQVELVGPTANFTSERVALTPGQSLRLNVQNYLPGSYFASRR